jgi:hypothetical protein
MSIVVATASEERGILLTPELILPRLTASVVRVAVVQVGTPTFWGFGRRRLDRVSWLASPGPGEEQTLLAAPLGEHIYWGCDSTALVEQVADLYGGLEPLSTSDDIARELHAEISFARQALGEAGLPVALSLSHDMDLLVVAGPEEMLLPLLARQGT